MTEPTPDRLDRLDRLDTLIAEGRLIRHAWTGADGQGRETACLLAALAPEAGEAKDAESCPAQVMPEWLAHLTTWMDDEGTEEAWPKMVRRYARLVHRWHVLTDDDWRRLDYTARAVAVREARAHASDEADVLAAVDGVLVLLDRAGAGASVDAVEWRAADRATRAAAWVAARTEAAWAAEAAAVAVQTEAAADRITAGILDAIEDAITERGRGDD